ncbi:MAG TPA: hypothetical protein PKD61_24260 [Polyangiaceae bacterium]|nr:hypothetical protein [Polyangiaceae bacterium]
MEASILNVALELAMAFGKDWLAPVQPRLRSRYPSLSFDELDAYDAACRRVLALSRQQAPACWRKAGARQSDALKYFGEAVRVSFPWVNRDNLAHLFSQGCYYAWKNGDLP